MPLVPVFSNYNSDYNNKKTEDNVWGNGRDR